VGPGIDTAGTVGTMTRRNEMAKKPKTFWIAREKVLDYWTGEVDEMTEVLIFQKKPKKEKTTYIRHDPDTEKDITITDIHFGSGSLFEMCPDYFEGITGVVVEPGTTVRVRLDLV